jgi:hypothetical protein
LQLQFAPRPFKLDHHDLPAGDASTAGLAKPLIVERIPEMEFVEIAQGIELIFRAELKRSVSAHASYTHNVANRLQSGAKLLPA